MKIRRKHKTRHGRSRRRDHRRSRTSTVFDIIVDFFDGFFRVLTRSVPVTTAAIVALAFALFAPTAFANEASASIAHQPAHCVIADHDAWVTQGGVTVRKDPASDACVISYDNDHDSYDPDDTLNIGFSAREIARLHYKPLGYEMGYVRTQRWLDQAASNFTLPICWQFDAYGGKFIVGHYLLPLTDGMKVHAVWSHPLTDRELALSNVQNEYELCA